MALVVEDGTGLATAESYVSVVDALAYVTDYLPDTDLDTWSNAGTSGQEKALRVATQYLDEVYGPRWKGRKVDDAQALDWPRHNAYQRDGWVFDADELPPALVRATTEAALRHLSETDGLLPDISDPGAIESESVKIGPISESIRYQGGKSQVKRFRKIDLMVADLVLPAGRMVRG